MHPNFDCIKIGVLMWLRELDLNQRPSGYEPDELPSCSIPRSFHTPYLRVLIYYITRQSKCQHLFCFSFFIFPANAVKSRKIRRNAS